MVYSHYLLCWPKSANIQQHVSNMIVTQDFCFFFTWVRACQQSRLYSHRTFNDAKITVRRVVDISFDQNLAYRKRNRYPCTYKQHKSCSTRNTKYLADSFYNRLPGPWYSSMLRATRIYWCIAVHQGFNACVLKSKCHLWSSFLGDKDIGVLAF